MITVTKQENGVLFTFQDSDKYLYGSGTILVPFNSLSIVADESDMITLKKAASNDVFISARYDTDFGYRSKDDAIDDLKDLLFAETGGGSESGITSGEVQTMIDNSLEDYYTDDEVDAALSGKASVSDVAALENEVATKADTSAVTAVASDVSTLSGQVATKVAITDFNAYSAATDSRLAEDEEVTAAALNDLQENKADTSAVTAVNDALTAHTSNTGIHVSTQEKNAWNAKAEPYSAGTGIEISGNVISATGGGGSYVYYTEDTSSESATIKVQNDDGAGNLTENRVFVDGGDIIIESYNETDDGEGNTGTTDTQVDINSLGLSIIASSDDGIDTTQTELEVQPMGAYINSEPIATEPYVNAAISGKVDTSAITTSITSGSTDAQVPSAKATYEAITAATTGGGATYSAGTNISIDTANTINCTLPITVTSNNQNSIKIGGNAGNSYGNGNILIGSSNNANFNNGLAIGSNITLGAGTTLAVGKNINTLNENQSSFGFYNVSNKANTNIGDSGNTLVSVGNGYYHYPIEGYHNALEIRQNGDIYFADTDNTTYQNYYEKPMVRLQDMYTALGGLKFVQCTQAEYDALVSGGTVDSSTIYFITNVVS